MMSISRKFQEVSRRFVLVIAALSVLSVCLLSFVLYETNSVRFGGNFSSAELSRVAKDDQVVAAYLQEEKDYEAHFVTLANLVKRDHQRSLGNALLLTTIPVVIIVTIFSYFVAQYLLKPVRDSYESQERFLQDAAHELRNPLAAMSLAIENADASSTESGLLKTMSRQTKRLIRINEDLLYLERRSSGEPIAEINISELLKDVLEDLQPAIAEKKLALKMSIQKDIYLTIDQKDFIKLSRNLIENAIKYSKPAKQVHVALSQDKNIELLVKDQGIGIPASDLAHIGQRFYRSKNVGKIDGTGLGIAIVRKVLNLYAGQIMITSKEGQGTTVKVIL